MTKTAKVAFEILHSPMGADEFRAEFERRNPHLERVALRAPVCFTELNGIKQTERTHACKPRCANGAGWQEVAGALIVGRWVNRGAPYTGRLVHVIRGVRSVSREKGTPPSAQWRAHGGALGDGYRLFQWADGYALRGDLDLRVDYVDTDFVNAVEWMRPNMRLPKGKAWPDAETIYPLETRRWREHGAR